MSNIIEEFCHRFKLLLKPFRGLVTGKWPLHRATKTLILSADNSTLTGKIRMKMAFDRNPKLTLFADKLAVRGYVANRVGEQYLSELLGVIASPEEIYGFDFSREFALKSNNGSGAMILVWDEASKLASLPSKPISPNWNKYLVHPSNFDVEKVKKLISVWLSQNYYWSANRLPEWAYKNIPPKVIQEELLLDENNLLPTDFKFFMVNGECEFIQVDKSRYEDHRRNLYNKDWQQIHGSFIYKNTDSSVPKPKHLEEMIDVAERLSAGVDFVRVDLYETRNGVKFGELTNYPEGGSGPFTPSELNVEFGRRWNPYYGEPNTM